jgi:hypothetical protein
VEEEDQEWLFDARRDYMEQLVAYKTPGELMRMEAARAERQKTCAACGEPYVAKKRSGKYCSKACKTVG